MQTGMIRRASSGATALRCAFAVAASLAAAMPARASCPPQSTPETHVWGGNHCLAANSFGVAQAGPSPVLVVVVHGDISDGGRATYHAAFARAVARPGVVAVALMRPGYADADGRTSDGQTLGRRDNYTPAVVAAVGGAIRTLKRHYRARRVVYVGHSGGAAIGGVLIGSQPGLIDAALLISCPCDIQAWLRTRRRPPWKRSLSPSDFVKHVPASTIVLAITGSADPNTGPELARRYAESLAARGVVARFEAIEGAGHGFGGLRTAAAAALDRILGD